MTDLNDVKLIGRIVKDSVLEKKAELSYAKFSIAVNRDVKSENGDYVSVPTYFDLAIFGNFAEKMYIHLTKGRLLLVQGSLIQRHWTKDDLKMSGLGISVNSIKFLSPARKSDAVADSENSIEEISSVENTVPADEFAGKENIEPPESELLDGIF